MWPFNQNRAPEVEAVKPVKMRVRYSSKAAQRSYTAAKSNELTFNWGTSSENIDTTLMRDLPILRARSRDQYKNNDYMKRFIALVKTNVIGQTGVALQVHAKDTNGQLDTAANAAIENAFLQWSKKQSCDYQRRLSFKDIQRLVIGSVFMDGEAIVQLVSEPNSAPFATSVLLRQPETLDHTLNKKTKNGNHIRLGIEFDNKGRAVAYYFKLSDQYGQVKHDRVPAERILHLYLPEFIEQVRGVPQASASLSRLNNLGGFEEAALIHARAGATKMGFITEPENESYVGDDTNEDGFEIDEAAPGSWHLLPAGYGVQEYDPAFPSNEFGEFVKASLRGVAAGLGVSYHNLANDLEGVNYSSGRLGELADREVWKALQDWFVESFMQPVFETWLKTELLAGNIRFESGQLLPAGKFDKFNAAVWQPRRWQWVDPQKEMTAHEKAIALKLKSRSEIIREMGRDPNEVWQEIKRENDYLKQQGIDLETAESAVFLSQGETNETE